MSRTCPNALGHWAGDQIGRVAGKHFVAIIAMRRSKQRLAASRNELQVLQIWQMDPSRLGVLRTMAVTVRQVEIRGAQQIQADNS